MKTYEPYHAIPVRESWEKKKHLMTTRSKIIYIVSVALLVLLYRMLVNIRKSDNVNNRETEQQPLHRSEFNNQEDTERINELALEIRKAERSRLEMLIDLEPKQNRTPDVIIIGARKCGTGALRVFLGSHPLLVTSEESHYYDKHQDKGLGYYKSLLENATAQQLIVDKTPAYFTSLPEDLPSIIKRDCPGVKLIIILCEPVQRSLSDYANRIELPRSKYKSMSFERHIELLLPQAQKLLNDDAFEDVLLAVKKNAHLTTYLTGAYSYFLPRWVNAFPKDHLLILNGESFLKDPGLTIVSIQEFLAVPVMLQRRDFFTNRATGLSCLRTWWDDMYGVADLDDSRFHLCLEKKIKGRTRSRVSKYELRPRAEEKLREFYEPFNKDLRDLLWEDWSWLR